MNENVSNTLDSAWNNICIVNCGHHDGDTYLGRRQWSGGGSHAQYCSKLFLCNVIANHHFTDDKTEAPGV